MPIHFWKYHSLGNDYLVLEPGRLLTALTPSQCRWLCHRHYGIGGDGLLFGPSPSTSADFKLRIYNPDGSEAEKSGNGLRIFARHLWDRGQIARFATGQADSVRLETLGGIVQALILAQGRQVRVEMGQAIIETPINPETGLPVETLQIGEQALPICRVSLGNPHCVVLRSAPPDPGLAHSLGPWIERHPLFPQRTNIQFLYVRDRGNLHIEIWERGAGYTLASGSSSCAAFFAALRLGLCDEQVAVHMPGGTLKVEIQPGDQIIQTGPVEKICEGWIEELKDL